MEIYFHATGLWSDLLKPSGQASWQRHRLGVHHGPSSRDFQGVFVSFLHQILSALDTRRSVSVLEKAVQTCSNNACRVHVLKIPAKKSDTRDHRLFRTYMSVFANEDQSHADAVTSNVLQYVFWIASGLASASHGFPFCHWKHLVKWFVSWFVLICHFSFGSFHCRSFLGPWECWSAAPCLGAFGEDLWMPRHLGCGSSFHGGASTGDGQRGDTIEICDSLPLLPQLRFGYFCIHTFCKPPCSRSLSFFSFLFFTSFMTGFAGLAIAAYHCSSILGGEMVSLRFHIFCLHVLTSNI